MVKVSKNQAPKYRFGNLTIVHGPVTAAMLDQVRAKIRLEHYSIRTEQAYADWKGRYASFQDKPHPSAPGRFWAAWREGAARLALVETLASRRVSAL